MNKTIFTNSGDAMVYQAIRDRLEGAGYQFHTGLDEGRPELGLSAWWFTWSAPGMADCEVGPTCVSRIAAEVSAIHHFFDNATIPMLANKTIFTVEGTRDCQIATELLVGASTPFQCEPMPDDQFEIAVKREASKRVERLLDESLVRVLRIRHD